MTKFRGYQNTWWLTLITILTILIFSLISALIPTKLVGEFGGVLIGELFLIIPIIIGAKLVKKKYLDENETIGDILKFRKFNPLLLPTLIFLPMSAQYFASYMSIHFTLLTNILFGAADNSEMVPTTAIGCVQIIISLCVFAPILEEILCRGIIMKMLEKYGIAAEIIISGFVFALLHFSIQSIIVLFFVGVLLGVVKKLTGSIFPCMIMHSINNLTSFIMVILTEKDIITDTALILPVILLFTAFPFLVWGLIHICGKEKHNFIFRPIYKKGFSVGLILCILLFTVFHTALLVSRIQNNEIATEFNTFFEEID